MTDSPATPSSNLEFPCPHCQSPSTTILGMFRLLVWYVCSDCGRHFSAHVDHTL